MKNIILDVGGVIFDDSKDNIRKLLNKDVDTIYKTAYGEGFTDCLLGNKTIKEHIESLKNNPDYEDLKYILSKENQKMSYPLLSDNFKYIKTLKERGYKLYLLTNITEDSYYYIDSIIDIKNNFEGGIYSYQEHLIKPDANIYKLIINKYNLDLKETVFFDDRQKNVDAAIKEGITSIKFTSINDIKDFLNN